MVSKKQNIYFTKGNEIFADCNLSRNDLLLKLNKLKKKATLFISICVSFKQFLSKTFYWKKKL